MNQLQQLFDVGNTCTYVIDDIVCYIAHITSKHIINSKTGKINILSFRSIRDALRYLIVQVYIFYFFFFNSDLFYIFVEYLN